MFLFDQAICALRVTQGVREGVRRCHLPWARRVPAKGDRGETASFVGFTPSGFAFFFGGRCKGMQWARARAAAPSVSSSPTSTSALTTGSLPFRRAALAFAVRFEPLVFPAISNCHALWLCMKRRTGRTKVSHDSVCRPDVVEHVGMWRRRPTQSQRGAVCGNSLQGEAAWYAYGHAPREENAKRTD